MELTVLHHVLCLCRRQVLINRWFEIETRCGKWPAGGRDGGKSLLLKEEKSPSYIPEQLTKQEGFSRLYAKVFWFGCCSGQRIERLWKNRPKLQIDFGVTEDPFRVLSGNELTRRPSLLTFSSCPMLFGIRALLASDLRSGLFQSPFLPDHLLPTVSLSLFGSKWAH